MVNKLYFTSIFLLLTLLLNCSNVVLPFFDKDSAFEYLIKQTDFGPRNLGSTGHQETLDFLYTELNTFADLVNKQEFTFTDTLKDTTFTLTNLIASFNLNPANGQRILLTAHWDTRPFADRDSDPAKQNEPIIGANDGASGVAVLLEIAKILKQNPPDIGVDIIFFDGEDYGEDGNLDYYFLGSKHFVKNKGDYRPSYAVLLDMVGDSDQSFPLEGFSMQYAGKITQEIWSKARKLGLSSFVNVPGPTISDDHLILNQAGIPTVEIIDFDYPYWHTSEDTPDKCSPDSLEQVGILILYLIYE